ncbi:hypothetical protein QM716_01110 [Rhodococcus sp. IEGM 1409]|uniref:hypothetical protein n=1 Tax=Rhodococcus sp. IEGM 1409 TaxID=3047082 RepID=UPI0024B85E6A|nr:hypothetical protein [Rhodococcus sp. IEGM 1409]MDI9898446.1 hypothetical protein [Rhodococcus sp. IEGM 1409]
MPPRARKTATKPSQADGNPTTKEVEKVLDIIETPDEILDTPKTVDDEGAPIPAELQFSTEDLPDLPEDDGHVEYLTVDGFELRARKPDPSAWNLVIGMMSDDATAADKARSLQTFINHIFDEPSRMYINRRLFTRGDKFDQDFLERIVVTIIERFTPETNREQRRARARATKRTR